MAGPSQLPRGWEGLRYLVALEELEIRSCGEMTSVPQGVLQLPSLRVLKLKRCSMMESLEAPQLPLFCTTLQHLEILLCHSLTALPQWVGDLTSLQSLWISRCQRLATLPDEVQCLPRLQVTIYHCPSLEARWTAWQKSFNPNN